MSELNKYIILSDGAKEYAVIFDAKLAHIDVAHGIIGESSVSKWSKVMGRLSAVAAGFVAMPECVVTGRASESLKMGPRPQDQALMRGEYDGPVEPVAAPKPFAPKRSFLDRARTARG